jgi:hypothetical protein
MLSAWLLAGRVPPASTRVSEPARGVTAATLDLRAAAAHLEVMAGELDDELFACTGHRATASLNRVASVVRVRQARAWLAPPHPPYLSVTLNRCVAWNLRVRAAGLSGTLDLRRTRLHGFEMRVSGARFRADLPAPLERMPVWITGRGIDATLRLPAGVPVRVWREDGWRVEGASAPWEREGYDVWLRGSAARCRLETAPDEPGPDPRPWLTLLP